MSKSEKLYTDFFGREPSNEYEVDLDDMKELTDLGAVTAIEYRARKHTDKKAQVYRHSFHRPHPRMLSNGKQIIIYGVFTITERGIEG